MFARRKKSAFKGPMLNSGTLGNGGNIGAGLGSPAIFGNAGRVREASASHLNMGLLDARPQRAARAPQRKSLIITEEDEELAEEEDIEEVEAFPPVDLARGESVHSIVFIDDPGTDPETDGEADIGEFPHEPYIMSEPDKAVVNGLREYEENHVLEHAKEETDKGIHQIKTLESRHTSPRETIAEGVESMNLDRDHAVPNG